MNSNDFSTNRRNTDNSVINLRLKESPNYQSIMDLWTETMTRQGNFYTVFEDEEMGNTDENITPYERHVPHMIMRNLVTAIRMNWIPENLSRLLKGSKRFRINSYIDNSANDNYASTYSRNYVSTVSDTFIPVSKLQMKYCTFFWSLLIPII